MHGALLPQPERPSPRSCHGCTYCARHPHPAAGRGGVRRAVRHGGAGARRAGGAHAQQRRLQGAAGRSAGGASRSCVLGWQRFRCCVPGWQRASAAVFWAGSARAHAPAGCSARCKRRAERWVRRSPQRTSGGPSQPPLLRPALPPRCATRWRTSTPPSTPPAWPTWTACGEAAAAAAVIQAMSGARACTGATTAPRLHRLARARTLQATAGAGPAPGTASRMVGTSLTPRRSLLPCCPALCRPQLALDPHLADHVAPLYQSVRNKALTQVGGTGGGAAPGRAPRVVGTRAGAVPLSRMAAFSAALPCSQPPACPPSSAVHGPFCRAGPRLHGRLLQHLGAGPGEGAGGAHRQQAHRGAHRQPRQGGRAGRPRACSEAGVRLGWSRRCWCASARRGGGRGRRDVGSSPLATWTQPLLHASCPACRRCQVLYARKPDQRAATYQQAISAGGWGCPACMCCHAGSGVGAAAVPAAWLQLWPPSLAWPHRRGSTHTRTCAPTPAPWLQPRATCPAPAPCCCAPRSCSTTSCRRVGVGRGVGRTAAWGGVHPAARRFTCQDGCLACCGSSLQKQAWPGCLAAWLRRTAC